VLGGLRVELARPAAAGLARLGLRPDLCRSGLGQPRGPVPASGRSSGCRTARVKIGGVLRDVLPRSLALRASGGGARILLILINQYPLVKHTSFSFFF